MCPWITALLLLATIGLGALPEAQTYFGLTATEPIIVWGAGVDDNQTLRRQLLRSRNSTNVELCDLLKLRPRQRRLCRRARGTATALVEAARIAVLECRFQFMYDRWNCSLGAQAPKLFRKGFRETAFAYSLSSSALVHALARACGRGALERCSCDEAGDARANREAWRWGGCGDNIKFGLKTSRRFLRSHRWGRDLKARVDHHNSVVGMRTVQKGMRRTCKCHGVSGSCTVKTCWRQLLPFHLTATQLKQKYNKSVKVVMSTNSATGKRQLIKLRRRRKQTSMHSPSRKDLVHIEKSPNYCKRSAFSLGTRGRVCDKQSNCDVMCCGRGYNVMTKQVTTPCRCRHVWCCYVKCETCVQNIDVYTCK